MRAAGHRFTGKPDDKLPHYGYNENRYGDSTSEKRNGDHMIETFSENEMKYYVLKNDTLGLILRVNSEVLELVHFGRPLGKEDALFMSVIPGTGYGTSTIHNGICADILPLAWSESGIGDLRESPVEVQINGKPVILNLKFDSA